MGPVRLTLAPHHANVRIARLVAGSVCRMAGLAESLTDDIRLAIGEACGRAVSAHEEHGIADEIAFEIETDASTVSVSVQDRAPGGPGEVTHLLSDEPADEAKPASLSEALTLPDAIAIIEGLADELEVRTSPSGTTVFMHWRVADPEN